MIDQHDYSSFIHWQPKEYENMETNRTPKVATGQSATQHHQHAAHGKRLLSAETVRSAQICNLKL